MGPGRPGLHTVAARGRGWGSARPSPLSRPPSPRLPGRVVCPPLLELLILSHGSARPLCLSLPASTWPKQWTCSPTPQQPSPLDLPLSLPAEPPRPVQTYPTSTSPQPRVASLSLWGSCFLLLAPGTHGPYQVLAASRVSPQTPRLPEATPQGRAPRSSPWYPWEQQCPTGPH